MDITWMTRLPRWFEFRLRHKGQGFDFQTYTKYMLTKLIHKQYLFVQGFHNIREYLIRIKAMYVMSQLIIIY